MSAANAHPRRWRAPLAALCAAIGIAALAGCASASVPAEDPVLAAADGSPFDVQAGRSNVGEVLHAMAHLSHWVYDPVDFLIILFVIVIIVVLPMPTAPPT